MKKFKQKVAEITSKPTWEYSMGLASIFAAVNLFLAYTNLPPLYNSYVTLVEGVIVFLFTVDYVLRLWVAENKWAFFKGNIIELLAIIPFSLFFQSLRVLRLLRLIVLFQYTFRRFDHIINQGGIVHITIVVSILILSGSFGIYFFERGQNPNIDSFGDALWWSLVTITTVGYGDIFPVTPDGRVMAGFLMLVGMGVMGLFTALLAAALIRQPGENQKFTDETLVLINRQLHRLEELDADEFANLQEMLHRVYYKKKQQSPEKGITSDDQSTSL